MKAFLPLKVAACCVAAFATQIASPTSAQAQLGFGPRGYGGGGLAISLTAAGYQFVLPPPSPITATSIGNGGIIIPTRASLAASVLLSNRSNADINFTFPDPASAATHFTFRVLNADEDVIWQSD